MCGACMALKAALDGQGAKYEERNADRLTNPEDDIDVEAFLEEVLLKNIDPKNITLPLEYNYEKGGE